MTSPHTNDDLVADLLVTAPRGGESSVPEQRHRQIAQDPAALPRSPEAAAEVDAESARFYTSIVRACDRLRQFVRPSALLSAGVEEATLVSGLECIDLLVPGAGGWSVVHPHGRAGSHDTPVDGVQLCEGSAEEAALRGAEPVLVAGTSTATGCTVGTVPGAGSSVVIPVVDAGRVLGLLRGAHPSGAPVRPEEVAALAAFAAALSGIWSSVALVAGWSEELADAQGRTASALQRARVELTWGIGVPCTEESEASRDGPRRGWGREDVRRLSPRGRVVLRHLLNGADNRQIADELGLKLETVRKYTRQVLRELGVKNRFQLNRDDPGGGELRALVDLDEENED